MRFYTALLISALMLTACAHQQEASVPSDKQEALLSQARLASKELMSTLQSQLKSAIQAQGPAGAVSTCSVIAPAIATQVGKTHDLQIRRVSAKNRNPQSQADDFESQQLKVWEMADFDPSAQAEETEAYQVVTQDGELHFRYMKPIRIQQACLQCHGQAISPQVQAVIQEKYPGDLATGYALNDLRGAVSVNIKIPSTL